MEILWIRPLPPGSGNTVARLNVALDCGVRLFGLRLVAKHGKHLLYGPNASGAGVVTFTPELADKIAKLALAEMERVTHDRNES